MNNHKQFQVLSDQFEQELSSSFKKDHGIYYTDIKLSEDIVNFLSIPFNSSIIDPCCGSGAFIQSLLQKGYTDVYGCDFDEETVKTCASITGCKNLFCQDTIGPESSVILTAVGHAQFDYVIGNPPYAPISSTVGLNSSDTFKKLVSSSGNNLYVAALYRAFEIAREDGIISVIIPKSLLHIKTYSKIRKYILENKSIISIVELGIHFKEVRGEQIVLTLSNHKLDNSIISFYAYSNGAFVSLAQMPQSFYKDEIIAFTNNQEASLFTRFVTKFQTLKEAKVCSISRGRSKSNEAIRGKQIRKYGIRDRMLPTVGNQLFVQNIYTAEAGITATFAGDFEAGETITVVKANSYEISKYLLGLLHSRVCNYYLVRFAYNNSRLTMHADGKYLYSIPFVLNPKYLNDILAVVDDLEHCDYLSDAWFDANEKLNSLVYDVYGLRKKEIQYIEQEMRTISSSKWYKDGNSHTVYY